MTAFLVIGGVGLLLLLVSLIAGDLLDGAFGAVGALDAHSVGGEFLGGDLAGTFLSGAAVSGFLAAFGFAGAGIESATGATPLAISGGLLAGVAVGGLAGWLTKTLMRGGTDATVRSESLVGHRGSVISEIPPHGLGQVGLTVGGQLTRLNARCDRPLPAGTSVVVTAVDSPTAVTVAALSPQDRPS